MRRLGLAVFLLIPPLLAAADPSLVTARLQFDLGDFSKAVKTLEGLTRSLPNDASVYYWLGRCYFELGNYDLAISDGERAVKLAPNDSDYLLWLGRAYGRDADVGHSFWMALRSKDALENAVRADPRNVPARRDLSEFYLEAPWIVGGSKTKAREQIAAISAIDPVQGQLAQAEYDRKSGDTPRAEAELKAVLQEKPKTVGEYYEVADFFASHADPTSLEQAIDGAASIAPSDPRLAYYRGVVLAIEGQHLDEAGSYLKGYLATTHERSNYPPHADARTWLGRVYEKEGRRLDAAQQFQAALQLDPHSEFARQSLTQLEKQ
jgi:uncharacterized protein HemY